ncbi:MAG: CBS domain-containing protein [Pseudomonadota bacterium]
MENGNTSYNIPFFFSKIIGKPVADPDSRRVGRVSDIVVSTTATYPKVVAFSVKNNKGEKFVPINQIETGSLWNKEITLKIPLEQTQYNVDLSESVLALKKSVLDRQIVDLNGAKVIRVNDIRLLKSGNDINVTDVDVGYRGILRRLGVEEIFEHIINAVKPKNISLYSNKFVSWEYVHTVPSLSHTDPLKLNVPKEQFKKLNPADIAAIIEDLDYEQRKNLINQIPDEIAARVLSETDEQTTQELIGVQEEERAADILEQMPPDKAADILGDMQEEKAQDIIEQMEDEEAETVTELLEYEDNTAGGLMTTEYISFPPSTITFQAIQELINASKDQDIETVYEAFIVDNSKLVGTVTLREMLTSLGHKPLGEIMNKKPVTTSPKESAKKVAKLFSKYNLLAMPVVQKNGELEGIITVDDVVEFLVRKWK